MKLLTFLGVGRYDETEYVWNGQSVIARYAPVASCRFAQASKVVIFATAEAQQAHGNDLKTFLPLPDKAVCFIPVPTGRNETELWQIFSQVAGSVTRGDELAFDVTHGLRSFPLIGLLAAAFLRVGFGVELKAVYYGAFDVRDQSVTPSRTPMFDLTPMLALLEWAAASDRFNRTGDSRYFASLLRNEQTKLALQAQNQPQQLAQIGQIGKLSHALTNLSQALALVRPHQVMQQVDSLPAQAQAALPILTQTGSALPFQMLLDSTLEAYAPLALANPSAHIRQDLETQRVLIRWYAAREHWVQAVSLAREWLVSWVMFQAGLDSVTILGDRYRTEGVVNGEAEEFIKAKKRGETFRPVFLKSVPEIETMLGLWKALTDTRNDINHAGMRESPEAPENLVKCIKRYVEEIFSLPL